MGISLLDHVSQDKAELQGLTQQLIPNDTRSANNYTNYPTYFLF